MMELNKLETLKLKLDNSKETKFDERIDSHGNWYDTNLDTSDWNAIIKITRQSDNYEYFLATDNNKHTAILRRKK